MNLNIFAHTVGGYDWGNPFEPWEVHPHSHLPIAFLLAGVAVDLYAGWRGQPHLSQVATGLLVAGVLTAPAGLYWHAGVQAIALAMFAWPAQKRWRNWTAPPTAGSRRVNCLAAVLLLVGSSIGGYIVYHGGAGIDPQLLTPEVRQSHSHDGGN